MADLMVITKSLTEVNLENLLSAKLHFIKFPEDLSRYIPAPLRTSIFIRPLYRRLLKAVLSAPDESATVISGNPGQVAERQLPSDSYMVMVRSGVEC